MSRLFSDAEALVIAAGASGRPVEIVQKSALEVNDRGNSTYDELPVTLAQLIDESGAAPQPAIEAAAPELTNSDFESRVAQSLQAAFIDGWAACRDAEYPGDDDVMNSSFNQSATLALCVAIDQSPQTAASTVDIKKAVDRFLGWRLPKDFSPDCGISFKRESDYEHPTYGRSKYEPTGTNLLTAEQAKAMFEYVLDGAWPASEPMGEPGNCPNCPSGTMTMQKFMLKNAGGSND